MADLGNSVPVEEGEEYAVRIEDVGEEGDGVATVEDFVVFVPGADLGEHARIEIDDVAESYAVAEQLDGGPE